MVTQGMQQINISHTATRAYTHHNVCMCKYAYASRHILRHACMASHNFFEKVKAFLVAEILEMRKSLQRIVTKHVCTRRLRMLVFVSAGV